MKIGKWIGKVNFIIVGIEFMKKFEAMIMPHLMKLYIYDGREAYH